MPSNPENRGTGSPEGSELYQTCCALADLLREEIQRQRRDEAQQGAFAASRGWASLPDQNRLAWRGRVEAAIGSQGFTPASHPTPDATPTHPKPRASLFRRLASRLLWWRRGTTPASLPELPAAWQRVAPTDDPEAEEH